jgi:AraC family transcriptional regulator of adaptative response/methylated-DNA-[protein]-cysteine methyltransferase
MVDRLRAYIEDNLDKKLTLSVLSEQLSISPFHLQRTFKRIIGVTPRKYIEAMRLAKMRNLLMRGETVNKAIYKAGFSSRSRFYENGSNKLGMIPGAIRRGGEGTKISYTIAPSPLGQLLVAGTEFGVCAICIADSAAAVRKALSDQYPSASLRRDDEVHREWVWQILEYLTGRERKLNLPLDLQSTTFQTRVWQEIKSIPYGETTTYSKIARAIGNPKAVRAVARACATNPVALIIPCHRVVGEDGGLHGYRWGEDRKQRLLLLEQPTNR